MQSPQAAARRTHRADRAARRSPALIAALAAVAALVLVGCSSADGGSGSDGSSGAATDTTAATDAATDTADTGTGTADDLFDGDARTLVVRVVSSNGYTRNFPGADRPPTVSIYGDGTVLGYRNQAALAPDMVRTEADRAAVRRAVARLDDAGLLTGKADLGRPDITDLGTTTVRVRAAGRDVAIDAYGLGSSSGLDAGQRRARAVVSGFIDVAEAQLRRSPRPWTGYRLAVRTADAGPDRAGGIGSTRILDWPLDLLTRSGACLVLEPDQAARVVDAAGDAERTAQWRSNGRLWALLLYPVLPDQQGCPSD